MGQELNMSAGSILALFDTTKEQRNSFVNSIVRDIKNGDANPLKVHLQVKCLEDLIEQLKKDTDYKNEVLEAAIKQLGGAKSTIYHSSKIEIREVGVSYDFSVCNDEVIDNLNIELEDIKNKVKLRQEFLKKLPNEGIQVANNETGEIFNLNKPVKKGSTTSVIVTLQ